MLDHLLAEYVSNQELYKLESICVFHIHSLVQGTLFALRYSTQPLGMCPSSVVQLVVQKSDVNMSCHCATLVKS